MPDDTLRIGVITWRTFPPNLHIQHVIDYLSEHGHEVKLICEAPGENLRNDTINGVSVEWVAPKNDNILRQLCFHAGFFDYHWYRRLKSFINRNSFDLLHVIDLYPIPTVLRANKNDIPVVAGFRELYPEAMQQHKQAMHFVQRIVRPFWRYKRLERKALAAVDGVLTESPVARNHYLETYNLDSNRVGVCKCVPDIERLRFIADRVNPPEYQEDIVVTYAGKFTPQRDLTTLLRAVAKLSSSSNSVRLLLVGDGPIRESLEQTANYLGIENKVTFTGWVDFERMFDYLAASDIGVCSARPGNMDSECSGPNKLYQYMYMQMPVIVGNLEMMSKIVRRYNAGIVVPSEDEEAMAAAIKNLRDEPDRAREMGQNGRRAVENDLNFANEGGSILEMYRTVLA